MSKVVGLWSIEDSGCSVVDEKAANLVLAALGAAADNGDADADTLLGKPIGNAEKGLNLYDDEVPTVVAALGFLVKAEELGPRTTRQVRGLIGEIVIANESNRNLRKAAATPLQGVA